MFAQFCYIVCFVVIRFKFIAIRVTFHPYWLLALCDKNLSWATYRITAQRTSNAESVLGGVMWHVYHIITWVWNIDWLEPFCYAIFCVWDGSDLFSKGTKTWFTCVSRVWRPEQWHNNTLYMICKFSVPWWRHQMKHFPRYWHFVGGLTGDPSQRPVTRSFDAFFDLGLNKRLSKQSRRWWFETPSCSLSRHCHDKHNLVTPILEMQWR